MPVVVDVVVVELVGALLLVGLVVDVAPPPDGEVVGRPRSTGPGLTGGVLVDRALVVLTGGRTGVGAEDGPGGGAGVIDRWGDAGGGLGIALSAGWLVDSSAASAIPLAAATVAAAGAGCVFAQLISAVATPTSVATAGTIRRCRRRWSFGASLSSAPFWIIFLSSLCAAARLRADSRIWALSLLVVRACRITAAPNASATTA
ncbi:hypothetical protein [Actinophytocola sediminis]